MAQNRISPFDKAANKGAEQRLRVLTEQGYSQGQCAETLKLEFSDGGFTKSCIRKRQEKLGLTQKNTQVSEETMLEHLLGKGYQLVKQAQVENKEFKMDTSRFSGDKIRLGVVSDTHLGSKYQQITFLNAAYDYFAEQGITDVLHAGDMVAGNGRVYRGQVYELFRQGADETIDYAVAHYPKRDGITTHVIAGNHDLSFLSSDGLDVVKAICSQRDDLSYLGHYSAMVTIGKLRIGLHHGEGGVSYARSYKLQKLIEQLSPDNKPHIFVLGHYHVVCELPMYRNVFGLMLPCFEDQTPYLVRKGLYPELGFYTLDVTMNPADREDGTTGFEAKFHPFYVPKKNDY
jgi:predicted phosphodiesterase